MVLPNFSGAAQRCSELLRPLVFYVVSCSSPFSAGECYCLQRVTLCPQWSPYIWPTSPEATPLKGPQFQRTYLYTVSPHYFELLLLQIPHHFRQQLLLQLLCFQSQLTSQLRKIHYFRQNFNVGRPSTFGVARADCNCMYYTSGYTPHERPPVASKTASRVSL